MDAEIASAARRPPSLTVQAAWLLIAKLIGFAFSLAAPLIIVRILTQQEFGLYKQAFLVITAALNFLPLAFSMNVFYFLPRRPAAGPKIVLNVLIVHGAAGFAALAVLLLYPQILDELFGTGDLVRYAPLIGIAACLSLVGFCLEVIATANQDVKYSTTFIIGAQFTKGVATVLAALIGRTLEALLYAAILQAGVQLAVLLWYLRKKFPGFLSRPDWKLMREQVSYAVPFGVGAMVSPHNTDIHMFMVAHRFSPAEYAIYAVGCLQLPLISLLRQSVTAVLIPRISYLQHQQQTHEIIKLLATTMRKLALVYWPVYVFLTVIAYEFIQFLYTSQYIASGAIFQVYLSVLPLAAFLYDPFTRAFPEHTRFLLKARLIETVVLVIGLYFGIQLFGMYGAIVIVVLMVLTDYIVLTYKIVGILGITREHLPLFSALGRIAACAVVAGIAAQMVRMQLTGQRPLPILLISGVIFFVVYVATVVLLHVPTVEETGMLRTKLLQLRRVLRLS
jgi:O-antigen/teichoic acid export membrane protein